MPRASDVGAPEGPGFRRRSVDRESDACPGARAPIADGSLPMDNTFVATVLAVVARVAGAHRTPPNAGGDTPLAQGGFRLDSVGLLELIVACEEAFGLSFDPERDLNPKTLATVRSLAAVIHAKRTR